MIEYLNVLSNNYKEDIAFNQWINGHIAAKKICTPSCGQCGVVFTWDHKPPAVV